MSNAFDNATYGAFTIGYGDRPAILVINYQKDFTDPACTMGKSPRIHAARDRTAALLAHGRKMRSSDRVLLHGQSFDQGCSIVDSVGCPQRVY